jgi:hypothetical protein
MPLAQQCGRVAMKLLSVYEIKAGLEQEFLSLEPMLVGFRLVETTMPESAIECAEKTISTPFPQDFRELIARFDFGNLTIGPVVFGTSGDYLCELTELNRTIRWWGNSARPANLLMVGNSDPFAIIMDTCSGFVYELDPECGVQGARKIADSFLRFFLGLGTVMVKRYQGENYSGLAMSVSEAVGGVYDGFWLNLAKRNRPH